MIDDIFSIFREPSDIDPICKDSELAANSKTTGEKTGSANATGAEPSKEDHPTGSRLTLKLKPRRAPMKPSASVETNTNQEPPTGNQPGDNTENPEQPNKDIPETEGQASSPPLNDADAGPETNTFDTVEGPARPPQVILVLVNLC